MPNAGRVARSSRSATIRSNSISTRRTTSSRCPSAATSPPASPPAAHRAQRQGNLAPRFPDRPAARRRPPGRLSPHPPHLLHAPAAQGAEELTARLPVGYPLLRRTRGGGGPAKLVERAAHKTSAPP